ncbi:hypothetical protein [Baaleninema simplex]|uniref:hypothetical protein n=1 Tax=Baaleninema simplex TaxID=2862350 RepID=UPI00034DC591|nr:hypothetical protein [Baaleninema simplex]
MESQPNQAEPNTRSLVRAALSVRQTLKHYLEANSSQPPDAIALQTASPELEKLQDQFGLSAFESQTLLLCVAAALWSDVGNLLSGAENSEGS